MAILVFASSASAYYDPSRQRKKPSNSTVNFREACVTAKAQIDQDVNNVRARLTTGGDVWWDRSDGKYVVPKVPLGQTPVSSIYAGAVWLGGLDDGGNLKVACQTYGNNNGNSDFWPGPLDPDEGTTTKEICDSWDKFFEVSGIEIKEHLSLWQAAVDGGTPYTEDMIPAGVKGWPAKNNEFFFDVNNFLLPETDQGLAGFFDQDADGDYEPLEGDFPTIEVRGCEELPPQFPDEMIFWIYNDEGGGAIHGETNGIPIRMEIQVQAFGYATNDQINDMTFQRYKLINRAKEDIDSTYFAMWVDADLGCYLDDYVGCDIERSLAYTYNVDAEDGQPGITCGGVPTYGTQIPIIGIDYFRGPRDENGVELGMSSFTYMNNTVGGPPPGTTDPAIDTEFYNYLSGSWRDGTPFSFGGDGYDPANQNLIDYAFPGEPNDGSAWSMCNPQAPTEFPTGLPPYDRRTVQASGPFLLQPGATNELIIGAVWVPDLDYPCPDITKLLFADDLAQDLFDNCFDIIDGPDAPDVDWIALDRELIAVLTNKPAPASNNYQEAYQENVIGAPGDVPNLDTTYNFEGYLIYQVASPDVSTSEFDDPTKAKLVYWVDVRNGVKALYNWVAIENPGAELDPNQFEFVFYPEVKIEALDNGIRHTFNFTEDQFATGDRRLINHRKYYYTALAYGTNNFIQFDPLTQVGQKNTFLVGRNNIGPNGDGFPYTIIPRPIVDKKLNAAYGDGPVVTRLDGEGAGGNFLDMSDETKAQILDRTFDGTIVYKEGRGPIDVRVFNPLEVKDGDFELTFIDDDMSNDKLDENVFWKLKDLGTGEEIVAEKSIEFLNEQIFGQYGFSISIGQTADAGQCDDEENGAIGAELTYADLNAPQWFTAVRDGFTVPDAPFINSAFDFLRFDESWDCNHETTLGAMGDGFMVPYQLADYRSRVGSSEYPFYLTPAWRSQQNSLVVKEDALVELNNIDIVFTSDKSKWSRCIVVEMFNSDYASFGIREDGEPLLAAGATAADPILSFDLRNSPSVGKEDSNGDGLADPDGDGIGMGWFPGYAVDVETGRRLNIFFGENSAYSESTGYLDLYNNGKPNGADMMFNPSSQLFLPSDPGGDLSVLNSPMFFYAGGQHTIYVTNEDYYSEDDGQCKYLRGRLDPNETDLRKVNALKRITWAGMPMLAPGQTLKSYAEGIIPNELTIKLRVDNPYEVFEGTNVANGYPTYKFKIEGKQAEALDQAGINEALDKILMVPNPYYAFSDYEDGRLSNIVKITNLPSKCTVTIYSLDGKFIRQYNRDELPGAPNGSGTPSTQIIPDIEWDLRNSKGIPVSAGVYLVHVDAGELGQRTLKWFGVTRQYDPTGL
ncbi:MAG: hypothetical protein MUC59_03110 [Saprospiraceae bacterium]|nr:hypothetical protein [Saprospiraceae bacterium]